jgi:ubiE/COQ5 methyltransferase family
MRHVYYLPAARAWHTALTVAVLVQSCKCLYLAQVPNDLLRKVYDTYSFNVIPKVGEVVANDKAAYQVSATPVNERKLYCLCQAYDTAHCFATAML